MGEGQEPLDDAVCVVSCRLGEADELEREKQLVLNLDPQTIFSDGAGPAKDDTEGTDFHATAQGHVSITPLKVDLTDHDQLEHWAKAATRLTREGS